MRGRRSNGQGEDGVLFGRAMRDVEPLESRERIPRRRRRRARAAVGRQTTDSGLQRFDLEAWGEQLQGRSQGVPAEELTRLRAGKIPIDQTIDLHRLTEEEARAETRSALARVRVAGGRCLRIVHGRGLRSPGGPVLKESLPGWLAEAPHGSAVLAFTTAPPGLGGAGATLVLLRRPGSAAKGSRA